MEEPWLTWDTWWKQALSAGDLWAHNMFLATSGNDGQPHCRNVTLHKWSEDGFVFTTNLEGPKAAQIAENPKVSGCFRWPNLDRQVRITGEPVKAPEEETTSLFRLLSKIEQTIFFATSQGKDEPFNQSSADNYDKRKEYLASMMITYHEKEVPVPPSWSAFVIKINSIEFLDESNERWQYTKTTEGKWERINLCS